MNTDDRCALIEAQKEAAATLDAGRRLAERIRAAKQTGAQVGQLRLSMLGNSLTDPAEFWSGAAVLEGGGHGDPNEAAQLVKLAIKVAAGKMENGDLSHARETLIGQAAWASTMAVKIAGMAENERLADKTALLLKVALAAQRQAAAAICSAAALNKLNDADTVGVLNDS